MSTILVSRKSAEARGYDDTLLDGWQREFAMPDQLVEESIKSDSVLCYLKILTKLNQKFGVKIYLRI